MRYVHGSAVNRSQVRPGEARRRVDDRRIAVGQGHGRTLRSKARSDREPYAPCTAKDHRNLTFERQLHGKSVDRSAVRRHREPPSPEACVGIRLRVSESA